MPPWYVVLCPTAPGAGWRNARSVQGVRFFESVRLLGGGEVARKFACALPSKAALCARPRVTATDCGAAFQGNIFQRLGFPADLTFPARWPQRMLARQSRSSRGHSLSARYRSRPRRIRKPPSIPPEHPFLRWSRRAVFPTPPGFWEKPGGSVPSGIAIPRIAWATRTSPESWVLPSRTDAPRVRCAARLRGKSFGKFPAKKRTSGPWAGGKQA